MHEFKYDDKESFTANFNRWFLLNTDERRAYNEDPYGREEAFMVFKNYVKDKWQEDQKKKSHS
jgi:uncharacterized protein YvpB